MKKNSRISLWLMLAAFVLCLAARLYQIVVGTDMTTGFLYHDNGFVLDFCFYGLVILTFAGAFLTSALDSKKGSYGSAPVSAVTDARAAVIGFAMLLVGLCAAYEGYVELNAISPSLFVIATDFIFGAAIIVVAFVTLYKKEFKPGLGFSYVIGGGYFTLRGIAFFLNHMVITSVPEYLIECLSVIGGAVFFMLLAKLLSGNEKKLTRISLCAFGVTTAVMTLSSALATILAGFTAPEEIASRISTNSYTTELFYQANNGANAYLLTYTPWVNAAMGIFAAAALIVLFMGEKKPALSEPSEQEAEDNV